MSRSLWRELLYRELAALTLEGKVLDLGGSHTSVYHKLIKGEQTFAVANLDNGENNDFTFDFEGPFLTQNGTFDGIICLNVLEHVFNYQNVLNESYRTLCKDGTIVLAVPFLIRYHPCPHDHWRYTEETLKRIFAQSGFVSIEVRPIGTGAFGAAYSLLHNAFHFSLLQSAGKLVAKALDKLMQKIKPNSTLTKTHYPLGYLVIAKK